MSHNHNLAYKSTMTCSALTKDGVDGVCTCTVKYYYDAGGLKRLETEATNQKDAEAKRDGTLVTKAANDVLAEVAAVK